MTGRLASRAVEAEALLARFNEVSESALAALDRHDGDALDRALDVRAALQLEIERAAREIAITRSRFAPNDNASGGATRVANRAMAQYCAPLEQLARAAQLLQHRLEQSATRQRDDLLAQIESLGSVTGAAARYATVAAGDPHRFDVRL